MGHNVVEHWEDDDSQARDSQSGNESVSQQDDSEADSMVNAKSKESSSMNWYAFLKMFNILVYITTLCLAFGYFTTTKYESKFVYYMFQGLVITRPSLIMLYSIIMIMLEFRRRGALKMKKKKGGFGKSDEEVSESQDQS